MGNELSLLGETGAPMSCPLCQKANYLVIQENIKDFEYGAQGQYQWVKCACCDMVRLFPVPSPEILTAAYPPDYHAFISPKSGLVRSLISFARKRTARNIASQLKNSSTVLDIGCSTGELLFQIQQFGTFSTYGVEYNPTAAKGARKRGIRCWDGDFIDANIPKHSMDFVIMQHVIEHVNDPVETLRKIYSILRPGGRVVGELPNFDSWDAQLFRRYWGGGHAPRHLWHFTPLTLERTLQYCGFESIKIFPSLHTGHWALSIQHFLRQGKTTPIGLTSGRAWYYPFFLLLTIPVNLIQMLFNKTGVMRFEACKPK